MMATMKEWVTEGIRASGWLMWAPLVAAYAPRGLRKMYFNLHLRRYARRLVPFLDPFVTIDIVSRSSISGQTSIAFEEAKAYLIKVCSRDVLEFSAEGTVEGSSFMLSLGEGQEVADHFRGVTVWWLLVPPSNMSAETRLRLMFPQRHRALILDEYLPGVRRQGREDMLVTIDIAKDKSIGLRSAIDEFRSSDDSLFEEVKAYLTNTCSRDALNLCAEATVKDDNCLLSLREGAEVADRFRDVTLWWLSVPSTRDKPQEVLRLMFPQQHRVLIVHEYLPHVRRQGSNILFGKRSPRFYANQKRCRGGDNMWSRIDIEHPATFDTLAMHPNKRRKITEDLDNFRRNKDYYRRIGKPWKRGYLLYGPAGTGKSTMIAAMANYLNYDIYDVELTSVSNNTDLRNLFNKVTSKSIIVIEDIDCCFEDFNAQRMKNMGRIISSGYEDKEKVTMSGLLNFIDGVWSAQSGERIIVLTTNFLDKLDPSLVRRGRMDMHIEMSYCCFEAFKTLARNYLDIGEHPLFQRVEELLQVVEIIPADVAECLLKADVPPDSDRGGVETCLGRLIDELEKKAQEEKDNKAAAKPKRQRR